MMNLDLNSLFLTYGHELRVFLTRKVRCPEIAADLTQEIFVRLAALPSVTMIENMRSYLYRTANNLVIDHFREEERRQTFATPQEDLLHIPENKPGLEREAIARQELLTLAHIIDELPERTREIFLLNRVHGLTYMEVARQLELSESSVQKHLAKALTHVMTRIKSP
jgi:RNA polymerase sigma factor (sigma-70 family)